MCLNQMPSLWNTASGVILKVELEEKIRLHKIARELHSKGLSTRKIAKIIGVSKSAVWNWINGHGFGNMNMPNLSPSPELSYIIGAILGDGSVFKSQRHYAIALSVCDYDFIMEFNRCICSILGRKKLYSVMRDRRRERNYSDRYRIRFSSKVLFHFLHNRTIKDFQEIIDKYPAEFVRGFADAEGSVFYKKGKKQNVIRVGLSLANTNYNLLKFLKEVLEKHFGIKSYIEPNKLVIWSRENIKKFYKYIGFTIKRKQNRLINVVSSPYQRCTPKEIIDGMMPKIIQLRRQGLGCPTIAKMLGIGHETVRLRLKKSGIW